MTSPSRRPLAEFRKHLDRAFERPRGKIMSARPKVERGAPATPAPVDTAVDRRRWKRSSRYHPGPGGWEAANLDELGVSWSGRSRTFPGITRTLTCLSTHE